jgi:hypothetical protein
MKIKALVMNAEVFVTKTNRFVTNVEAVVIYKVQIPDFVRVIRDITRFLPFTKFKNAQKINNYAD